MIYQQRGLSLMELMITLVIVAVIAGMVYPGYRRMVSRSKQTEAKTVLQAIYMGQDLHKTSNQIYTDNLEELDVEVPDSSKYTYSIVLNEDGTSFVARATANIDDDVILDEWQINQDNVLENTINDVIED